MHEKINHAKSTVSNNPIPIAAPITRDMAVRDEEELGDVGEPLVVEESVDGENVVPFDGGDGRSDA